MKIEKMSDTQIRVTLNHADLRNRDIKIGELAYGSSKAQDLFRDMMAQAYEDFGFETENVPLMIEAVPLSPDSIMIVVTKVEDPSQIDEKLDAIGERPTHRTFKDPTGDRMTDLELMGKANSTSSEVILSHEDMVYAFDHFDSVCSMASHIQPLYFGDSYLYKYQDKYFVYFKKNHRKETNSSMLISQLNEFGQRVQDNGLNEFFLKEHGQCIVNHHALDILAKYA